MPRFRDLIPLLQHLPTGDDNAITDVSGVTVGHVTLNEGDSTRTGVTAILPHTGNIFQEKVRAAVYTINGFGKATGFEQIRHLGTIETPILLTNTLNVGIVWDAVVSYMLRQNPDIGKEMTGTVNPVVGECNDGYLNNIQARAVQPQHVWEALDNASGGTVAEGCVGAGTGTVCYGFKGGIGTASRRVVDGKYTVGTLLQTNFGSKHELMMLGVPVGQHFVGMDNPQTGPGSVMIVVASDAPMTSRQLERMARRAAFGLGRTGTICSNGSGDFVIAFSTVNRIRRDAQEISEQVERINEAMVMDEFFRAVVETVEESVYNALVAAEDMTGRDGHMVRALPHDMFMDIMRHYRRGGN